MFAHTVNGLGGVSDAVGLRRAGRNSTSTPAVDPRIRALFNPDPGLTYLDTATYGLQPEPTLHAMRDAEHAWQAGTTSWVEWDRQAERARTTFGPLIGATASQVALMPSVSVGVGLVAADLPPTSTSSARAAWRSSSSATTT